MKKNSNNFSCKTIFQTIFNEAIFYTPKPGQLNLVGIDTITILDKGGYLNEFDCFDIEDIYVEDDLLEKGGNYSWSEFNSEVKKIKKKTYQIKKTDNIPNHILNFSATLEDSNDDKYRCYFVINDLKINGDTIFIKMEKFITNHIIGLTYVCKGDDLELIDSLVGQY